MNLKYMMLKGRYRFIYEEKPFILSAENMELFKKEVVSLSQELELYSITPEDLSTRKIMPAIKDELLNIAAICSEELNFLNKIKLSRKLPIKELCAFTEKKRSFFKKWEKTLLAYFIIMQNNYSHILSYLCYKKSDNFLKLDESTEEITTSSLDFNKGMVISYNEDSAFILNPYGDFINISSDIEIQPEPGHILSGTVIKQKISFKPSIKFIIPVILITVVAFYFIYFDTQRTFIINSNFSVKAEVNKWNKVIKVSPINLRGNEIASASSLFNKSIDDAILEVIQTAKEKSYITDTTSSSIYITGDNNADLDLTKTNDFIRSSKLKITINYNGLDITP